MSSLTSVTASPIHPVILCGGAGTRLWPTSRRAQPKQFSLIVDGHSLFQHAVKLVDGEGFSPPLAIVGTGQRFRVLEQLARIECAAGEIIVEPDARNTAPAVLAAALTLGAGNPDAVMLVLPSDHRIADIAAFRSAVAAAEPRARAGDLVTFGIRPTRPETGYGYLELATPAARDAESPQDLLRFVEKPDAARAEAMLQGGVHLWNAGIFLMSARSVIAAFQTHAPEIYQAVRESVADANSDHYFLHLGKPGWMKADNISIDYAIMEKASNMAVMPFAGRWSDLGDWASVWRDSDEDEDGNVIEGDALAFGCTGTLLRSEVSDQMLVGLNLDEMIVIATADAVLVAPRGSSQQVGRVVSQLRLLDRPQADGGRRDHRPWGWYESIAVRNGFQVKQIVVEPHQALSLQSHNQRAEHWIILAGTARVTVDEMVRELVPGDYVFIPVGAIHRLENHHDEPIMMVELQIGDYLGEDDIVRYSDRYARTEAV
ncbi:mannose-1-phosphate guanylyltransferase/mannose-6-phosphate isomerase [Polymorphobacter multimanifer]|uniref:mannose-1-phosphate guanylyltransferase n=1 Tax=Polymorphobacter multimanifer TaxID=1070431 RepID=A0A841L4M9_9SPHN|nr:mannose-1-phosphate guanylyltransferase/mannose-6-phosphate isomerase [Polymorphobacter multimanifer]MBB6227809.1 mannose-1-phosphate guanylyltransferase/mannose-6-phosphate isomerase [Polymorphobacter multimanifer]